MGPIRRRNVECATSRLTEGRTQLPARQVSDALRISPYVSARLSAYATRICRGDAVKRGEKIPYAFTPTPVELEPEWHHPEVSFYDRMLGRELHAHLGGADVRFAGDWREFLCRKLAIHGSCRSNAKKRLEHLRTRGLLLVANDSLRVLFAPPSVAESRPANDHVSPISHSSLTHVSLMSHPDLAQVAVITQDTFDRREEKRVEEKREESASAEAPATDPQLSLVEPKPEKPKRERKPRAPKAIEPDLVALHAGVTAGATEHGLLAYRLPDKLVPMVLAKARALAARDDLELEIAAHRVARGVCNLHNVTKQTRKVYHLSWAFEDWQPTTTLTSVSRGFMRSPDNRVEREMTPQEVEDLENFYPDFPQAGAL